MATTGSLIALVAAIIAIGVGAQVLADRFRVPSVGFLIAAGILLGPEGIGLVTRDSFGTALPAIVGLSVAIIVFEGAFHLEINRLRQASRETIRLVTVGAIISLVGTAVVVRYALGISWELSALIGALLIATGPTVITPIVEVVAVRDHVAATLETEGIVNDVTAAILAVVVFEALLLEQATPSAFLQSFVARLGVGLLVGVVIAGILWYALRHVDLSPGGAPQSARLLVLAGALVAFGAAETVFSEAGIAAVATAGMLLGNADIPYKDDITEFKGDVTLLVLSFVFIALAALLRFDDLTAFGLRGILVVVAVALIVRPLLVALSTVGGRFTRNERIFIGFVGPRGIIPASVATLFAIELQSRGMGEAATALVGTVFLVILATVVFQAGLARHIAEALDVIPMRLIIIGAGKVGRALAERLEERGENVVIIEHDQQFVQMARTGGFNVRHGDGTELDELRGAGVENARFVVP
ncbi:MAG: cation:proton antiporter, partial [Halobacteriales archaeon]|nr:cation:proton antiporter [Halobacteriales archaeon]